MQRNYVRVRIRLTRITAILIEEDKEHNVPERGVKKSETEMRANLRGDSHSPPTYFSPSSIYASSSQLDKKSLSAT